MMRIRNRPPTHPGRILKDHYLKPLSMNVAQVADVFRRQAAR